MKFLYLIIVCTLLVGMTSCENGNAATKNNTSTSSTYNSKSNYTRISQTPDPDRKLEKLNVKLKVEGMPSGTFYLMGIFAEQYFLVDSLSPKNGVVNFTRDEPVTPGLYYALYPDRSTAIQMIIDADQTFTLSTVDGDIINSMQVTGNKETEMLYETMKYDLKMQPEFNRVGKAFENLQIGTPEHTALIEEHKKLMDEKMVYLESMYKKDPQSLFTAFKEAGQNPNIKYDFEASGSLSPSYLAALRRDYWTNTNFDDIRLMRTPVISNKVDKYYGAIMPQQPDSIKKYTDIMIDQCLNNGEYYKYLVNWVTLKYEPTKTSLMDAEAVFVHMIQKYFTKERAFWQDSVQTYGIQMRAYEMGNSLVGQKGPDVTAKGVDGKTYSINDIKTPYVIVYMWNPECEHCAEQTPILVNLYNQQKTKEFEVYGIGVNTDDASWRGAVKKYGMPWISVYDPTNKAIYAKYYVDNTPELYVLNPERTIIGKNLKVDQVYTVIDRDKEKRGN